MIHLFWLAASFTLSKISDFSLSLKNHHKPIRCGITLDLPRCPFALRKRIHIFSPHTGSVLRLFTFKPLTLKQCNHNMVPKLRTSLRRHYRIPRTIYYKNMTEQPSPIRTERRPEAVLPFLDLTLHQHGAKKLGREEGRKQTRFEKADFGGFHLYKQASSLS